MDCARRVSPPTCDWIGNNTGIFTPSAFTSDYHIAIPHLMSPFSFRFLLFALIVGSFSAASCAATLLPASDSRFVYEGRFDSGSQDGPVVIWQGSRIRIDFEGDSIALQFTDAKGQNFFDVRIDDRSTLMEIRADAAPKGNTFTGLGPGRHQLLLFKRSEAAAGTVRFRGIELEGEATAFAPNLPPYKLAMQFIGDSITAGACNEDGPADQWDDRSTHNNARSYGAFTAAALGADYRNIAVSGMGIVTGWTEVKAGEIWDRIYPDSQSPRDNLTRWTPDIVFLNLGENDDSFTKAKDLPFPADEYAAGSVSLVQSFRQAYPSAQIVILRGGMFGGAQSERLRGPWESAVSKIEKADPRVSHFVFQHWSNNHPRVADHRAMADELIAWLSLQRFMQAYH